MWRTLNVEVTGTPQTLQLSAADTEGGVAAPNRTFCESVEF